MKQVRNFLLGALSMLIIVVTIPSFADTIQASFNSINILINGKKVASIGQNYTLDNGSSVPYSIVYKGTTYLPMKKLAELINKDITWDGTTKTAGIYEKGSAPVSVVIKDAVLSDFSTFTIKYDGNVYKIDTFPGSSYTYKGILFSDMTENLYLKESASDLLNSVISYVHLGYLTTIENAITILPTDNPILDGVIGKNIKTQNYISYSESKEYEGLNETTTIVNEYKSHDGLKTVICTRSSKGVTVTGDDGSNLIKLITINNVKYFDISYILDYLGIKYMPHYDTESKINVIEYK